MESLSLRVEIVKNYYGMKKKSKILNECVKFLKKKKITIEKELLYTKELKTFENDRSS